MNEEDSKAFEEWHEMNISNPPTLNDLITKAWSDACEYKQKEIDELSDLVFAIETNNKIMEELIDSLEKEKVYLCQKMGSRRNIYKEAEKLQEQNKKLRESQIVYNHIIDNAAVDNLEMYKLKEQNKKLRECVEFYASTDDKTDNFVSCLGGNCGAFHLLSDIEFVEDEFYFGNHARQVLKEIGE